MNKSIKGYAAFAADSDLAPFTFTRREPRADDVAIDILYCGVCHSDLHEARNDWGYRDPSGYPLVPGHEIIGRATSVGSDVIAFRPGDLVGVGNYVDSCRKCAPCNAGEENYCLEMPTPTYGAVDRQDGLPTYGGYSERIIASEKFVLRIPAGLDARSAAPLLCAGITSYSPLRHWRVGAEHKVAVIGLGGLGHMALKFAKALGAEVTLFTRTPNKEDEARRLGADQVVLSTDAAQMAAVAGRFDFILDTVPNAHDLTPYIYSLGFNGVLVLLGLIAPIEPTFNSALLLLGRKSITSSNVGSVAETQEMLDFCAAQSITCDVEVINIQDINVAFERLQHSDVRYRFVIDMASLRTVGT
jgi:uncharacterized zinc-type alcohol dehydrogenase-like protein